MAQGELACGECGFQWEIQHVNVRSGRRTNCPKCKGNFVIIKNIKTGRKTRSPYFIGRGRWLPEKQKVRIS